MASRPNQVHVEQGRQAEGERAGWQPRGSGHHHGLHHLLLLLRDHGDPVELRQAGDDHLHGEFGVAGGREPVSEESDGWLERKLELFHFVFVVTQPAGGWGRETSPGPTGWSRT